MLINATFKDQSSAGDWRTAIQLLSKDDGQPIWSAVPGDLVITLNVVPEGISLLRDYSSQESVANASVISATSTDGSGKLTALVNGAVEITIDDAVISGLAPDNFGVLKRYLVFIKIQTGGETIQLMNAILPVYRGI